MIPKILHYVWVGSKPLPEVDRRRIERWRQLHPRWEIRAWGNDDVDFSSPYVRGAFAARAWNRVSDYTRMDALARYGGVYLDTDFDVLRSFDRFRECQAFLGFQIGDEIPGELVAGGLFGAEAGHWLPTSIRDYLNDSLDGRVDLNSFTGPGLVTQMLRERGLERYSDDPIEVAGVLLLPRRYFYPYSWKETYSEDVITPDTYAVHRWAATWVDDTPAFRRRLRLRLLDRLGRQTPDLALTLSRSVAWFGTQRRVVGAVRRRLTARNRDPAPSDDAPSLRQLFDAAHYLGQLQRPVDDPLDHYVRNGATEGLQPHPLFDVDYYRSQAPDLDGDPLVHYLREGWTAGLDPHPLFSTRFYVETNPDVSVAGICPLVHYVRDGGVEERQPHPLFNPRFYREGAHSLDPGENPLVHFVLVGSHHRRNPSEWFDTDFYLSARPDVAAAGENALVHYVRFGWRERTNPHPAFDVGCYLDVHPDVRDRDLEPLAHHLTSVRARGHRTRVTGAAYPATIVIPVLRQRDDWLETSVRSALAQTIPCEVVVVTSPMTPPSNVAVLTRLADDRLVVHAQGRPGFAAAINAGIEAATAPRVGFLLSDDWLEPDAMAACLGSTADVVSTGRRCFAADGVRELVHLRRTASMTDFLALPTLEQQADYLTHFFLIRREVLLEVGGLDESVGDVPGVDDYDLIWVLLEQQATVNVVERFAYNYRDHDGERLTLRDPEEARRTLGLILTKHGVTGTKRDAMIAEKSRWFGRPLEAVAAMSQQATLGVCVLFFERPDQTIECLESLGDCGPPVYVWNNGSSPSAREAVGRYARDRGHLTLIDSPVNLGVAAGRNRLIEASREDLLLFLDSDITIESSHWESLLLDRAGDWPDVEVLVPTLFDVQAERAEAGGQLVIQGDRFLHLAPPPDGRMNFFPGGAACVRRTLFERVGRYDESIFVGLEDYELAIRAMRRGRPICARSVPDVVLRHDHRRAGTEADVRAARTRYSSAHVGDAYERLRQRHGVRYDADWQGWLKQQMERVVG